MPALIRHVGLVVPADKLAAARRFYRALGFMPLRNGRESAGTMLAYVGVASAVSTYKLSYGDSVLELLVFHDKPGRGRAKRANSPGITHVALTVTDMDGAVAAATRAGGKPLTGATRRRAPRAPLVRFIEDPCGNILELVEEPK